MRFYGCTRLDSLSNAFKSDTSLDFARLFLIPLFLWINMHPLRGWAENRDLRKQDQLVPFMLIQMTYSPVHFYWVA